MKRLVIFFALLSVGLNAQTIELGVRHNNSGTENMNNKLGIYGQLGYFISNNLQVAFQFDRIAAEDYSVFYPQLTESKFGTYPPQFDTFKNVTHVKKVWVNNFALKLKYYKKFSDALTCNIGPSIGFSFFHQTNEYQNRSPKTETLFSGLNLGLDVGLAYPLNKSKRLSATLNANPGVIFCKKANYDIAGYSGMNHSYTQLRLGLMWNFGEIEE
ncbi:MAG TPA: hypothetical protein VGF79_03445 [Bacteroidia bacterium]